MTERLAGHEERGALDLDSIRRRCEAALAVLKDPSRMSLSLVNFAVCEQDVPALLAEVERLRAGTEPSSPAEPAEGAPELPVQALNEAIGWLDNDGDERADDAIVKLTDAKGTPFAHVTAGWLREFITATNGTLFGECPCGRDYAEHTHNELADCGAPGYASAAPGEQRPAEGRE